VDIFFTLSGFLITSLLLREFNAFESISLRNFYIRRFLRLMPALWLTVAFTLACTWALSIRETWPVRDAVWALAYLTNWARLFDAGRVTLANGWVVDSPLAHTWSLAIEEQYYLLWPLVIGALCRRFASPAARMRALLVLFVCIVLYRAVAVSHYSAARIYFGLDTHSDGLILGSATAALLSAYPAAWSRLSSLTRLCLIVTAIGALLTVMTLWTWRDAMMGRLGFAVCALATTLLILDCVTPGTSPLRLVLSRPVAVWLGRISYGLYLWHFPVYFVVRHWDAVWNWQRVLVVGGSVTLALSAASYYTIETRFLRLKGRFVRASGARSVGSVPQMVRPPNA